MDTSPSLVFRGRCLDHCRPQPHYPEADFDDIGPQAGVFWAANNFGMIDPAIAEGIYAANAYVLPPEVFAALPGGTLMMPTRIDRDPLYGHRVYSTEAEALGALRSAVAAAQHP